MLPTSQILVIFRVFLHFLTFALTVEKCTFIKGFKGFRSPVESIFRTIAGQRKLKSK